MSQERREQENKLRAALELVEEDLAELEEQLRVFAPIQRRAVHLRQIADEMRALLARTQEDSEPRLAIATPAEADKDEEARRPVSTVDGVEMILREHAGESVTMTMLRKEFRERNWLKPGMKAPDAAIYEAARRLVRRSPRVERPDKHHFIYLPATNGQQQEVNQDS